MAYKSILTVVTSAKAATAQIDAAVAFARREDAHLDVLCLGIDRLQTGYFYVGAAPVVPVIVQETLNQAETDAREVEAAVRSRLGAEDIRWAVDTAIAQVGSLGNEVGRLARFADLVLVPQPYGPGAAPEHEAILEAALFDGRAPTLVLAPTDDPHAYPAAPRVAAAIAGSVLAEAQGAMVPFPDQAPEQFAAFVRDFLRAQSGVTERPA